MDESGNETTGVASVLHQAPLGSYLGWNVVAEGFAKGRSCGQTGGYIPFMKTKAERLAAGARPSVEPWLATPEDYARRMRELVEQVTR